MTLLHYLLLPSSATSVMDKLNSMRVITTGKRHLNLRSTPSPWGHPPSCHLLRPRPSRTTSERAGLIYPSCLGKEDRPNKKYLTRS